MLNALNQFDQDQALGVLSKLASQVAPEPLLEEERSAPHAVDFQHEDVLAEIRDRLGLAQNDRSDEARDRIISFIADQISEIVLSGVDEKAVRARLANNGILRPDLYEVKFHNSFIGASHRGIRRNHVLQALNYTDDVEHVPAFENSRGEDDGNISFYVKHVVDSNPYNSFSLLVVSHKKGYIQEVVDAVRVYPSDVDIASVRSPSDLLKAFLDKYGLMVQFGTQWRKLFFVTSIEKPSFYYRKEEFPVENPSSHYYVRISFTKDQGKSENVILAYAVDNSLYHADLRKHGVQVGY